MKTAMFTLALVAACTVQAQVNPNNNFVDGYYKSDGTYVPGHYRTNPNGTVYDNYSTYPNINPYTHEQGDRSAPSNMFVTPVAEQNWFGQGQVRYIYSTMPAPERKPVETPLYYYDDNGNLQFTE